MIGLLPIRKAPRIQIQKVPDAVIEAKKAGVFVLALLIDESGVCPGRKEEEEPPHPWAPPRRSEEEEEEAAVRF